MATADVIFSYMDTAGLILLYGWPFIILFSLIIMKLRWKKYPVDVVIIEKRGSNLIKTNDRAGKYTDAFVGITGYRLHKAKDTIPVINFDWVLHNVFVANTLLERLVTLLRGNIGTLFLFRYGSKQYKPIIIKTRGGIKKVLKEIKNKDGSSKIIYIYEQFDPRRYLGNLDFEVIDWDNMNFMVQEQRASILRRQKNKEFLMQILIPLGVLLVVGLVCIIMIKFSYDYAVGLSERNSAQANSNSGTSTPTKATAPNIPIISDIVPGS